MVVRARVGQVMGNQLLSSLNLSPAARLSWQVVSHAWVGRRAEDSGLEQHCGQWVSLWLEQVQQVLALMFFVWVLDVSL